MAELEGIREPTSPPHFSDERSAMEASRIREKLAEHGAKIASVERYLGMSLQVASLLLVTVSIMAFILWNTVNNRMDVTENNILMAIESQSRKIEALEKKIDEHIHARDLPRKPRSPAPPPPSPQPTP